MVLVWGSLMESLSLCLIICKLVGKIRAVTTFFSSSLLEIVVGIDHRSVILWIDELGFVS